MGPFPVITIGILLIACVILYQFLRAFQEMMGCWRWSKTVGRIVESGTEARMRRGTLRKRRINFAKILYEYSVNDKRYRSSRVYFGPEIGGAYGARKTLKYPTGAEVIIYYNPQDPREAVLERNSPALLFLLGIVVLITALCLMAPRYSISLKGVLPQFSNPASLQR